VGEIEMIEVTTTTEQQSETGTGPSATPASAKSVQPQALISEQQVLFSTVAAVALPPAKTRRLTDTVHAVVSAVGVWLTSAAKPPVRRHYPDRLDWLEHSRMSREMGRL
jgi:hypothetical protein